MSDEQQPRKRRGRPPLPDAERKGVSMTIRTRGDLRERIEAAAEAADRSITDEIEYRLQRSFEDDRRAAVEDALIGDKAGAQIVRAVAAVVADASRHNWTEFSPAQEALRRRLQDVIDRLVPIAVASNEDEAEVEDMIYRLFGSTVETFARVEPRQRAEDVVRPLKRA